MLFSSALSFAASCSTLFTAGALLLLHTTLKWPILLNSVHLFPYAGHCLRAWLLPQYLHISFVGIFVCMVCLVLSSCVFFTTFSLSYSFASVRLFIMVNWALCTLKLFAQDNTFLLVISSFSCIFASSQIISPNYQCHL